MKNFHVVALGALGASRIFERIQVILTYVIDWIKRNVCGIPDTRSDLSVRITKWLVRVKFFVTDEGIAMLRASDKALKEASSLYAIGVQLRMQAAEDKTLLAEERRMLNDAQRQALIIHNTCFRIKNYTSFRPTMFHLQFVGKAGRGKSTLTTAVVSHLRNRLFPSAPKENLVYALADTDHFDGYSGQLFVVGDDLWKYNDAKHCTTIISLITNTPVLLPMAHLEDKGTYLDSEIMISSVNVPYPKITDVLCLEAVYRRRHCLIHLDCDSDVIDESTSKYDDVLWLKKYMQDRADVGSEEYKRIERQRRAEFPHLRFSFLKPVPDLKQPFVTETLPDSLEEFHFAPGDTLPHGFVRPLSDLSWTEMISRVEARYRAMRQEESNAGIEQRKKMMDLNWNEIDDVIDTMYAGSPTQEHMYGWYLPAEVSMHIEDERAEALDMMSGVDKREADACAMLLYRSWKWKHFVI